MAIISLATKGPLLGSFDFNSRDLVDGEQDYSPYHMLITTFVFDLVYAVACISLPLVIYKKPDLSILFKMGLWVFFLGRFVVGILFLTAGNSYFKDAGTGAWIYEIINLCLGSCLELILLCYLSKLCDIIQPPDENPPPI